MDLPHHSGNSVSRKQLPRPLHIFPMNTRPLTDLKVILLVLPLLWLCGLEQIVPPILLVWATLKLLLRKPKLRIPLAIIPFLLFLLWQIVPQVSLEGSRDWIVFGRSMVAYISALCILLILANDVNKLKEVYSLIYAIVGLGVVATGIALLFAMQILPEQFQALLIADLLPNFLKNSRFVQESIIIRDIGWSDAVFGPFVYPRVSSLFLYPTSTAIGYICLLYWQWYLITISRRIRRWLLLLIFMFSLFVFLLTASRIAWLAFVISFGSMYFFRYQLKFRLPPIILPMLLTICIVLVFLISIDESLQQFIHALFLDIRADSFRARFILYESTLALWAERPLIGWGVPRPVAGVTLAPVGTHSELLGILFRSGIVGFLLYVLMILVVWLQIGLRIRQSVQINNPILNRLSMIIAAVFLSINLMHFTYSFYWDFSVVLLTWTTVGLIYSQPLRANSHRLLSMESN